MNTDTTNFLKDLRISGIVLSDRVMSSILMWFLMPDNFHLKRKKKTLFLLLFA